MSTVATHVPAHAAAHAKHIRLSMWARLWKHRHFYLFVSPFFISFAILGAYPLVASLHYSVLQWDGLSEPQFVGANNYRLLFGDPRFYTALWNTVMLYLLHVPLMLVLAFLFAVALNGPITRLRACFRGALFVPAITPMVVIALVFALLYNVESGLLNVALRWILMPLFPDFHGLPWRESTWMVKPSIAILMIWRWTGYNMVLMIAGLQGIPNELYEAAKVDGAGRFHTLTRITLPLMRPTFVFCAIMSLMGTVYAFDEIFVLTGAGPGGAARNIGLMLFEVSFEDFKFGYASALAYVVAAIIFVLTLVVLRIAQREVA